MVIWYWQWRVKWYIYVHIRLMNVQKMPLTSGSFAAHFSFTFYCQRWFFPEFCVNCELAYFVEFFDKFCGGYEVIKSQSDEWDWNLSGDDKNYLLKFIIVIHENHEIFMVLPLILVTNTTVNILRFVKVSLMGNPYFGFWDFSKDVYSVLYSHL